MTEQVTEEDWGMNFLDGFGKTVQEMPDQTAIVDMGGARSIFQVRLFRRGWR